MHVLFFRSSTVPCRERERKQKMLAHTRTYILQVYGCHGKTMGPRHCCRRTVHDTHPCMDLVASSDRRRKKGHHLHTLNTAMWYAVDFVKHRCKVGRKVAHLLALPEATTSLKLRADRRAESPPPKVWLAGMQNISPNFCTPSAPIVTSTETLPCSSLLPSARSPVARSELKLEETRRTTRRSHDSRRS
jgi:hypothetical protein